MGHHAAMLRLVLPFLLLPAAMADAKVLAVSDSGFRLAHEEVSPLGTTDLWQRLMVPARWWDPAHTYSGDAGNLSMGDRAGAYWREDWPGGSVIHGQVLMVSEGRQLVLSAPFGPLMGTGARCIWTITLAPAEGGGTLVSSTHVVVGAPDTDLRLLAGPVDQVMGNGIRRLAAVP